MTSPVRDGEVEHRAPDTGRHPPARPPAGVVIGHVAGLEVPGIADPGAAHIDLEKTHARELPASQVVVRVGAIPVGGYRVEPQTFEALRGLATVSNIVPITRPNLPYRGCTTATDGSKLEP